MVEFVDEAVSAYHDRTRPSYQRLLQRIEHCPAATVIVWHIDRLYRRPPELEQLLDLLDTHPIRIEAVQGGCFDLNRHEGRLFARQLVAFANYESAHKGARVARAQQQRVQEGLLHGGHHYGYRDDGTLNPTESDVVRRIVDDYLIGISPTAIAHDLTASGVRPPRTDRWGTTTIRSILSSDRLHHRRIDHATGRHTTGTWDPIISPEESALVQALLLAPRRDAARSFKSLLGGIARCPRCGSRLVAGVTTRGRRIYSCRTATTRCPGPNLDADTLDTQTQTEVLSQLNRAPDTDLPCPHELLDRVRSAQHQLTVLATAYGAGNLDHHTYLELRQSSINTLHEGSDHLVAHSRARILSLETSAVHQRWASSLPFRRAVVCALLSAT